MEIAKIQVHAANAVKVYAKPITSGMVGATVSFNLGDWWEEVSPIAIFKCGDLIVDSAFDLDATLVPHEVVAVAGKRLYVGLYGVNSEGTIALPTIWCDLGMVQSGANPCGLESTDPVLPRHVQVDFAQNDPTQLDYVKNRTHYTEGGIVEILPETTVTGTEETDGMAVLTFPIGLKANEEYIVTWNGTAYNCVAHECDMDGTPGVVIGNLDLIMGSGDSGEPFVILELAAESAGEMGIYVTIVAVDGSLTNTLSIYGNGETVHKLDNKYLDLEWLPVSEETPLFEEQVIEITGSGSNGEALYSSTTSVENHTALVGKTVAVYLNGNRELCTVQYTGKEYCAKTSWGRVTLYTAITNVTVTAPTATSISFALHLAELDKLPEAYLPESVESVVVRSSTSGSTKLFKITVDDTGTIAATEVT